MENKKIRDKKEWGQEAWDNWIGFWNLILQEDMKQNPDCYKGNKK